MQNAPLDLSRNGAAWKSDVANAFKFQRCLPCQACGKSFDRPSLLKRHIRIHTGERPHECPMCGKRFTASSNLYYHRMTHYKVSFSISIVICKK